MEDIQPTLEYLEQNGIRGIINYAAEDDVSPEDAGVASEHALEKACDKRLSTFMTSVDVQDNRRNTGFVAIKVRSACSDNAMKRCTVVLVLRKWANRFVTCACITGYRTVPAQPLRKAVRHPSGTWRDFGSWEEQQQTS